MSIYSVIRSLADEREVSIARMERDLKMSNGRIGKWDLSEPQASALQRVANYLGVTSAYILDKAKEETK